MVPFNDGPLQNDLNHIWAGLEVRHLAWRIKKKNTEKVLRCDTMATGLSGSV